MGDGLGIIDEESLNIFTDGSSYPKKKRAAGVGVRYVWVNDLGNEEIEDYFPAGWQSATIDEMEINACIVALSQTKYIFQDIKRFKRVLIFSDSNYVVNNFSKAMNIWPKRKWRGSNNMSVANIDLWKKLGREVKGCPIRVDIEWVKAHKSNIHNRAADLLAKKSASIPINKPLSLSVTTRKWSDRKTRRGVVPMQGQATKIRIVSRKYINNDKTFEYRYEIIDPDDKNFKDIDFIYFSTGLSRNKCYQVCFNADQMRPSIDEIIKELDCQKYKYE